MLERLAPDVRAAVVLVNGYGFDYADASRRLDVSPGTIGSPPSRARNRVRRLERAADRSQPAADAA